MVAMLGIPTYGIRACAKVRDDKKLLSRTVQELLFINFVMMVIAYTAFFITIAIVPAFRASYELYVICSAAILLNVIGVNWVYQALEEYTYITIAAVLFKIIGLVLMFMLVVNRTCTLQYGLITVISSFGAGLLNFIRLGKLVSLKPAGNWNLSRHIRPILTFFAMSVATTVYTNLDTVMLGLMKGDAQVGIYTAAIKVKSIMVTLVTSLGTVLLPRLSYYVEQKKKKEFHSLVSKAFSFVLLFAIPCCIFFTVFARQVVLILSGTEFEPAAVPMIILMPTIVLIGLSNITGIQILVPTGKEKLVLLSVAAGAAVDFVLNLIFIPLWGASGAAFGTLAAEAVVLVVQMHYLKKLLQKIMPTIEWKQLLFGLVIAVPVLLLFAALSSFGNFMTVLTGAILFFGVYALVLFASKEQIMMSVLRQLLARKGG
jgi:O-antigen/teichoic acid export membrane protein